MKWIGYLHVLAFPLFLAYFLPIIGHVISNYKKWEISLEEDSSIISHLLQLTTRKCKYDLFPLSVGGLWLKNVIINCQLTAEPCMCNGCQVGNSHNLCQAWAENSANYHEDEVYFGSWRCGSVSWSKNTYSSSQVTVNNV